MLIGRLAIMIHRFVYGDRAQCVQEAISDPSWHLLLLVVPPLDLFNIDLLFLQRLTLAHGAQGLVDVLQGQCNPRPQ